MKVVNSKRLFRFKKVFQLIEKLELLNLAAKIRQEIFFAANLNGFRKSQFENEKGVVKMKKLLSLAVVAVMICFAGTVLAEETSTLPAENYPADPTGLTMKPLIIGNVTLNEGWNLIAIPVLPAEKLTIKSFSVRVAKSGLSAISTETITQDSKGFADIWRVTAVAVYKNGRFQSYSPDCDTYNMVPGEAYFVYAKYSGLRPNYIVREGASYEMPEFHPTTTIKIIGKTADAKISLNLNKGWNGVAVLNQLAPKSDEPLSNTPKLPELESQKTGSNVSAGAVLESQSITAGIGYSLYQLSQEFSEQGIKATRIIFWNAVKQEWEQYSLPYPAADENGLIAMPVPGRLVNPSEGFFLLCEENGLYIPGLTLQNSPYPSIPVPKRVSYTGIIRGVCVACGDAPLPYKYVLQYETVLTTGTVPVSIIAIPIKGTDDVMEAKLAELANENPAQKHYVEGVMQALPYISWYSPGCKYVDVMIVEHIDEFKI
ncbi:MAG: hypothetical protein WC522_01915 [Candidatus Omnitrophota bacterium]